MQKPTGNEYPQNKYFSYYIEQVDNQNVIETLMVNKDVVMNLYKSLSEEQKKIDTTLGNGHHTRFWVI